jgi:hypothetical protein
MGRYAWGVISQYLSRSRRLGSRLDRNSAYRSTLLWLHRLTHQGRLTSAPSCSNLPKQERQSTKNVLPEHGFLLRTQPFSCQGTQGINRLSPANRSALALEQIYQVTDTLSSSIIYNSIKPGEYFLNENMGDVVANESK